MAWKQYRPRYPSEPTVPPYLGGTSAITSRFLRCLQVADPRYSLACYGDFLEHVPKRLGTSEALDAAVGALVSAFPYHYTDQLPSDALLNYTKALKALRLCISRTDKKLEPETLSAIYIIMICQVGYAYTAIMNAP